MPRAGPRASPTPALDRATSSANSSGLSTTLACPLTAAIPEQQFQAIPLRIREQEQVPAQRLQPQLVAHQPVETLEAVAEEFRKNQIEDAPLYDKILASCFFHLTL